MFDDGWGLGEVGGFVEVRFHRADDDLVASLGDGAGEFAELGDAEFCEGFFVGALGDVQKGVGFSGLVVAVDKGDNAVGVGELDGAFAFLPADLDAVEGGGAGFHEEFGRRGKKRAEFFLALGEFVGGRVQRSVTGELELFDLRVEIGEEGVEALPREGELKRGRFDLGELGILIWVCVHITFVRFSFLFGFKELLGEVGEEFASDTARAGPHEGTRGQGAGKFLDSGEELRF